MKYFVAMAVVMIGTGCGGEAPKPKAPVKPPVVKQVVTGHPVSLEGRKVHETDPVGGDFLESCAIGSGAGGPAAAAEKHVYAADAAITLSMKFRQSPGGLVSSIRVLDAKKRNVFGDMRAMKGATDVTFTIPPRALHKGRYVVTGYWGDNVACEFPIEVTSK